MLQKIKKIMENNLVIVWIAPIITGIILAIILNPIEKKGEEPETLVGFDLYKEFLRNPEKYNDEITTLELMSVSSEYGIAPEYVCNALKLEYKDAISINVSVGDNNSKFNTDEIISLYASGENAQYFEEIASGKKMKVKVQLKQFNSNEYQDNKGLCRRLLFLGMEYE